MSRSEPAGAGAPVVVRLSEADLAEAGLAAARADLESAMRGMEAMPHPRVAAWEQVLAAWLGARVGALPEGARVVLVQPESLRALGLAQLLPGIEEPPRVDLRITPVFRADGAVPAEVLAPAPLDPTRVEMLLVEVEGEPEHSRQVTDLAAEAAEAAGVHVRRTWDVADVRDFLGEAPPGLQARILVAHQPAADQMSIGERKVWIRSLVPKQVAGMDTLDASACRSAGWVVPLGFPTVLTSAHLISQEAWANVQIELWTGGWRQSMGASPYVGSGFTYIEAWVQARHALRRFGRQGLSHIEERLAERIIAHARAY